MVKPLKYIDQDLSRSYAYEGKGIRIDKVYFSILFFFFHLKDNVYLLNEKDTSVHTTIVFETSK